MTAPAAKPYKSNLLTMLLGVFVDVVLVVGAAAVAVLVLNIGMTILAVPLVVLGPFVLLGYVLTTPFGAVYRHVIVRRYLRSKIAPLFAAAVVTLCTMMVIIVISVMGGFLQMMRQTTRALEGDVMLGGDMGGIPLYEDLMRELKALPQVQAVSPVLTSYGLVRVGDRLNKVEVIGIQPETLNQVVNYRDSLYWKTGDFVKRFERMYHPSDSPAQQRYYQQVLERVKQIDPQEAGMTFHLPPGGYADPPTTQPATQPAGDEPPGIVLGLEVGKYNLRDTEGHYDLMNNRSLGREAVLTVLPITAKGGILEPAARQMVVVNEFKSGLYEIDANRVYVPFGLLQKMLRMEAYPEVDRRGEPTGRTVPGRAGGIMIRGAQDVPLGKLQEAIENQAVSFIQAHPDQPELRRIWVQTWEQRHAAFLGAVEKEKFLLTILFGIISLASVVMVAVIFYMIVLAKTREIGILRALGASRAGVSSIFVGYGLAIGTVGAGLGLAAAAGIVWNINEIQDWLNRSVLWLSGGRFGMIIWRADIYYFDRIPSRMDAVEVTVIVLVAVLSAVVGAIVPAIFASRLEPVEALRYE